MRDLSKIKHVVVLSMENRSFDQVFGGLAAETGKRGTIDVADPAQWTNSYRDQNGTTRYGIGPMDDAHAGVFEPDPDHSWQAIEQQIRRDLAGVASMSGFVQNWVGNNYSKAQPRDAVLAYLQRKHQPVSYFFAEEYTVLERHFAAIATGTMPNRFYALAGDSAGHRDNSIIRELLLEMPTVFDNLPDDDATWRVYAGALPTLMMVGNPIVKRANLKHVHRLSRFITDAKSGDLPRLSWLEPTYSWSSGLLARLFKVPDGPPNDDHPPSHTARGQQLFHDVYSALIADPERWKSTLLIVHYDEHGGFFDHVPPPAIDPADIRADRIAWRGPRVPSWLISPFAAKGGRIKQPFDHCSILKFIGDWFGVTPPGRANSPRTASIADALLDDPRPEAPVAAPSPPAQPMAIADGDEPPAGEVERTAVAYLDALELEDPALYKQLQDTLAP